MTNIDLGADYWENRYQDNTSRWDLGQVSPPIKSLIDSIEDKTIKILIPGGGNSWEAEYLHYKGFQNVFVVDIALSPLQNLLNRVPTFPKDHVIKQDFFTLDSQYDMMIEQTFFCAINPSLRKEYIQKAHQLLSHKGVLTGLLFDAPLNEDKPPFGGSKQEYERLFNDCFKIIKMDTAENSIESRLGRELFFEMVKK